MTVNEIRLERRSVPDQLRYMAAALLEDDSRRIAVAIALNVLANEIAGPPVELTPHG